MSMTLDALLRFQAMRDARAEELAQMQMTELQQRIAQLDEENKKLQSQLKEREDAQCKD